MISLGPRPSPAPFSWLYVTFELPREAALVNSKVMHGAGDDLGMRLLPDRLCEPYLGMEYSAIQYLAVKSSWGPSWYQMLLSLS